MTLARLVGRMIVACMLFALPHARAQAQPASVWDQIAKSQVLHVGLIPNRPPYQWEKDGKNAGFAITMGEDLADALSKAMGKPVRIDYVTTTWGTLVLDIQAGKIDVFFGMVASEERKKAIAMFGPMYSVPVVAVNREGFQPGDTWASYDTAGARIATIMGTADEAAARQFLTHATLRSFKSLAEASLDVSSRNSDAMITSLLIALDAKRKNPVFANVTLLQPVQAFPSGGGSPKDADGHFAAFTQTWSEQYRTSGRTQQVIMEAIEQAGLSVKDLPRGVQF
ncbi:MAG: transporter substrate-binding domain-containing protein [Proteobacteria bacterium]|nr:transporter substrate-binding domain-containing protein [Pseudomonadota bacterium]